MDTLATVAQRPPCDLSGLAQQFRRGDRSEAESSLKHHVATSKSQRSHRSARRAMMRSSPELVSVMRILSVIATGFCLALVPARVRANTPPSARAAVITPGSKSVSGRPCSGKSAKECGVSKSDFKKARETFDLGRRLKDTSPLEALSAFDQAVGLVPRDEQFVSAREALVQQLVREHIQQGKRVLSQKDAAAATIEFRKALELDPGNKDASQGLLEAAQAQAMTRPAYRDPEWEQQEIFLRPKTGSQSLHLSADAEAAYRTIGAAFGIEVIFDSSAPSSSVRLSLDQVTFEQAMNAVALVTRTFWTPVSPTKVLVAADSANKRNELERWLMRIFYLPETSSPQELTDIATLLRTLFEFRSVTQSSIDSTITVRGPTQMVLAATRFLQTFRAERPQVILDFDVYDINSQMLRDIGIALPSQFTIFSFPQSTLTVIATPDIQQAISQGIASGSINQTNGTTIPALISQVQQQNSLTTFFQNSLITFGGGKTLMGIQVPPLTASFSKNESRATSLSKVTMRGAQGKATTFRVGTRFPVITASYTGGAPTGGVSLGTSPITTFEDLGITIKATPTVHKDDVTLDLDMEMSSLGAALFNGIPAISQRSYKGVITVKNDEPAIVAVSVSRSELESVQGIPGVRNLPLLGSLTNNRSTQLEQDELLVIITPHSLAASHMDGKAELLLPRN